MLYNIIRELLFLLSPETAHNTAHKSLKLVSSKIDLHKLFAERCTPRPLEIFDRKLQNPVGLAAGFDKNAELCDELLSLGFGFLEVGSVTALPSEGNPRPRMFRLPRDKALINRMGLPNHGASQIAYRTIPDNVGVSIAKTPDPKVSGDKAIEDYCSSCKLFHDKGLYTAINVSCPNTEDGKSFEDKGALKQLLEALCKLRTEKSRPLLVKFSPQAELKSLVEVAEQFDVSGYIFSNTTKSRDNLNTNPKILEQIGQGGLSGKPLFNNTLEGIKLLKSVLPKDKALIAVGGISKADDVSKLLDSGADLVQMYTGFVYGGPNIVVDITKNLR